MIVHKGGRSVRALRKLSLLVLAGMPLLSGCALHGPHGWLRFWADVNSYQAPSMTIGEMSHENYREAPVAFYNWANNRNPGPKIKYRDLYPKLKSVPPGEPVVTEIGPSSASPHELPPMPAHTESGPKFERIPQPQFNPPPVPPAAPPQPDRQPPLPPAPPLPPDQPDAAPPLPGLTRADSVLPVGGGPHQLEVVRANQPPRYAPNLLRKPPAPPKRPPGVFWRPRTSWLFSSP